MRQTKKVSWLTADTNESIALIGTQHKNAGRFVYLLQPGKEPVCSIGYKGYAMFGQTNVYAWIAEMNFPDQVRNMSDDEKIKLGAKALNNNTPLLFPVKISYFPKIKYNDVEASIFCEYDGYKYPDEVLKVDGRTCGNCVFAQEKEKQCNKHFGIQITCLSNKADWKTSDYCSHFTPPNIIPDFTRTIEECKIFEAFHRDDFE